MIARSSMVTWALLWACSTATVPSGTPRSTATAEGRLMSLGVAYASCEGGSLGDEVSLACRGTLDGRPVTVDAVTTGAPLPETPGAAGAMVEDLWVEVRVEGADASVASALLQRYAGSEESR